MQDHVGLDHLFERGAERRHQHGRQVGNEAHGVGQDDLHAARQLHRPQCRVERGKQHVGLQHARAGHAVEQRRFAGIGVADQRGDRVRHARAAVAVELAPLLDLVELRLDARDPLADQAAIDFELAFARPAEKAEAAALALQMCPAFHQPAALIGQMRQLDLERALLGVRPAAEDFQDQPGAVEHLGVPRLLQVALLHRRERAIGNHDAGFEAFHKASDLVDLAGAHVGRGPDLADRHNAGLHDVEIDGAGEPDRLLQARIRRDARSAVRVQRSGAPERAADRDRSRSRVHCPSAWGSGRPHPCHDVEAPTRLSLRPAALRRLRTAGSDDPA